MTRAKKRPSESLARPEGASMPGGPFEVTGDPTTGSGEGVVDLRPNVCTCGCGSATERRFKQGHDQRLKGTLRRAHIDGLTVAVLIGSTRVDVAAVQAATYLDSAKFSWSGWLGGER